MSGAPVARDGGRLARFALIRPGETAAVAAAFAYFFFLLASYYVLRPIRDQSGIAGGVNRLPWLFTVTFAVMLVAQPVYGALVARFARRRFVPVVYHFFVFNLVVFWLLLRWGVAPARVVAQSFFVWISVFNLFAVSVFWSLMADVFESGQGKRLFGLIGAGGTAGALLGPVIALGLVGPLGPVNLLLIAALLLEAAVATIFWLERAATALRAAAEPEAPVAAAAEESAEAATGLGGGAFAGLYEIFLSPYLAGAALWVSLLSFAGTVLYLQQANLVAAGAHGATAQTRIFASIDLAVGIMTLILQLVASGQFVARCGVAAALAVQPLVFVAGFVLLAVAPTLTVAVTFQALQRTANFAVSNLGRQILFTTATREEKYKSKNVIDVVVFRGSDALYGWLFAVMKSAGAGIAAIAAIAAPVSLAWLALAIVLGRVQEARARAAA